MKFLMKIEIKYELFLNEKYTYKCVMTHFEKVINVS